MMDTVTIPRELLLKFVRVVDQDHDFETDWCHPTPGDDCYTWCDACALLRYVADDVLLEVRK